MKNLTILILAVFIISCGGGSGGSSTDTTSTSSAPRNYSGSYRTYFEAGTMYCSPSGFTSDPASTATVVIHHNGTSISTDGGYTGTISNTSFKMTRSNSAVSGNGTLSITRTLSGNFTENGWGGTWTLSSYFYSVYNPESCNESVKFYSY